MNNNKQSIKLYTEEQVIQAFKLGMNACMKHQDWALAINYPNKIELLEFMQSLTPIELPSNDEIQDESEKYYDNNAAKAHDYYFELGAKWMRDKIGGNNEQDRKT